MPIYMYMHPETEEVIEVVQTMNEDHVYVDERNTEWKRVFCTSQISSNKICDPWNNADFVNQTKNMKGSVGDMMDKSAEMSEMRARQNGGIDPVKEKMHSDYSKTRGGMQDPTKNAGKKVFENKHVKIKLD
ncbi:MAG: hypothetical protein HN786_04465 [Cellvibrionales bacterium]|jgi:hypothetical protein|nr:hypothetical protein [Cellvibrionales bacterium]